MLELNFERQGKIYFSSGLPPDKEFEALYLAVRQNENRIYSNEALTRLPEISPADPHYKEWQARKASSDRLVKYLAAKRKPLKILEIGCGNGWLCNKLSKIRGSSVVGLDINMGELRQASEVFTADNLFFVYGDLRRTAFSAGKFDVIIFASSLQYFPTVQEILSVALQQLAPPGEIHIIDTNFYGESEITAARQRSRVYYSSLGFPQMSDHYFHLSLKELRGFHFTLLPKQNILHRAFGRKGRMPWIRIKHA